MPNIPTAEPTITSESDFQSAVLSLVRSRLEDHAHAEIRHAILERFALDAAILVTSPRGTGLRLIEFKVYTAQRPGGVGFGTSTGESPQVDLLMLPNSLLAALNPSVRWCFADLTLPAGTSRYSSITCAEAKQAAMGKIAKGKQNNFRIKDALAHPLTWDELLGNLERFLLADLE